MLRERNQTLHNLQNNQILMYEGRFGFHRVANAKERKIFLGNHMFTVTKRIQYE